MSVLIVIPFRRKSERVPEKIYKNIGGAPLCARVIRKITESLTSVDGVHIVAAIDDQQTAHLLNEVLPADHIIMTDPNLPSGTDRVHAAAKIFCSQKGLNYFELTAIVNVQGDMPFISGDGLLNFIQEISRWEKGGERILTPYEKWPPDLDFKDLGNVKIATDSKNQALYFSRFPIPCSRNVDTNALKLHVGIYGFTPDALENFCGTPTTELEKLEGLEQLRALFTGIPIQCTQVTCKPSESFRGIDTPADLKWAEDFALNNEN